MEIVEGVRGERWTVNGRRLVDTPEWCDLYVAWCNLRNCAPALGSVVELAKRIPFRMVCHLNAETEHVLEYLNEPLNIACIIVTPYHRGNPGKASRTYGINERKAKGYKRLAALLDANPKVLWKAVLLYPPNAEVSSGAKTP
jgi:hypothetical protein